MECNKDEAIRAMQIAEMKMKTNDFEGARKIALKAQNLYPELENISQLLSICDVHCSAQKSMLGSEKDWYGVLQVEKFASELAIKKQYRRLALFLHPDKNRFPGAESAFKLICEANAVLSDPAKKSLYDSKIRVIVRSAPVGPAPHLNRSFQSNKKYGAEEKVSNSFNSLNQHQATQTSFPVRREVFCTSCPFCSLRYHCDRKFVNTTLRCQKCFKNFMGFEISGQGVTLASKWAPESAEKVSAKPSVSQSSAFEEKGVPNQGIFTGSAQNGKGFSASHVGSQWSAGSQTVRTETGVGRETVSKGKQVERAGKVSGNLKAKGTDSCNIKSWHSGKEGGTCNGDANNRETGDLKNRRKRGREFIVESSESYDTSSESDLEDVTIEEDFNAATNLNSVPSHANSLRRSFRKRQNVSYHESDDDSDGGGDNDDEGGGGGDNDDLPRSLKRSQGSKLSDDDGNKQKDILDGKSTRQGNESGLATDAESSKWESKEMGTVYPDNDADCSKGVEARGETGDMPDVVVDTIEIETDCEQDSYSGYNSDKDTYHFDDPEFNDFDKDRDVGCFAVNQFWACYDSVDGMPRFYAKVKKVCACPFELHITWLEADPEDDAHRKWIDEELPVGCGSFKLGKTETTSMRLTFSQQVQCEKGKKRGSLIIHPRKGEVWALFKDWDLSWSSNPEYHQKYKYEVVEVLSDFDAVAGIRVSYLDKVKGFVSLFQRSSLSMTASFMIRPCELYRFSHCISYFKMTGSESEGVPVGSFELDPASLPLNPDDLYYPGKAKAGSDNIGHGVNCVPPRSGVEKSDFVKSESSTPKEFVDLVGVDG